MKYIRRKPLYPGTDALERQPAPAPDPADEPDILETAVGYCPNYDKYDRKGWTPEKALAWCNMD